MDTPNTPITPPPAKIADHDVLDLMSRTGGSFVSHLAAAWVRADPTNAAKLMAAFGDYYDQYEKAWHNAQ